MTGHVALPRERWTQFVLQRPAYLRLIWCLYRRSRSVQDEPGGRSCHRGRAHLPSGRALERGMHLLSQQVKSFIHIRRSRASRNLTYASTHAPPSTVPPWLAPCALRTRLLSHCHIPIRATQNAGNARLGEVAPVGCGGSSRGRALRRRAFEFRSVGSCPPCALGRANF